MLKEYLQAVQAWIDAGMPEGKPFWRNEGLCGNAYYFAGCPEAAFGLRCELRKEFRLGDYNNSSTPFNDSYTDFLREVSSKSLYSNPQRLEWIKNHAQDSN